MKRTGRVWFVFVASSLAMAGCHGAARHVWSCDECQPNANQWAKEYCVGTPWDLYCANPCKDNIECGPGFWCMASRDQGTPYEPGSYGQWRWVCMPQETFSYNQTGLGTVRRMPGDCGTGGPYGCAPNEQCLVDDTLGAPYVYFCASSCFTSSDCLSGCCADVAGSYGGAGRYCAYGHYCQ